MVVIKVDRVYELTILLCGLERERGVGGRTDRECTCKPFARQKKVGSFREKGKYRRGKGGREKCWWE